jgi:tetratricopeptide (TPR) repeat protein
LSWSQQAPRPDIALQILPALHSYYDATGQWVELLQTARVGAEFAQLTGDISSQAQIANIVAWIQSQRGQHEAAEATIAGAIALGEQLGDVELQLELLQTHSQALRRRGAFDQALAVCRQAIALCEQSAPADQEYLRANIEYELGKIERDCGRWLAAQAHFNTALKVFSSDDDRPPFNLERAWGLLGNLGMVAHQLGDLPAAAQMYAQALQYFRQDGTIGNVVTLLVRLAALEEQRGNQAAALEHAREALEWSRKLGMVQELAQAEAIARRLGAQRG